MGYYDNCRPGYCAACGAAPGNHNSKGVCLICHPEKDKTREKPRKESPPNAIGVLTSLREDVDSLPFHAHKRALIRAWVQAAIDRAGKES